MNYSVVMKDIKSRAESNLSTYGENRWICTVLYGSQNYNIDTKESDIDTRTLVFPSKEEIFRGIRAGVWTNKYDNGEDCIKDVRDFIMNAVNGGISFLECLYSPFVVINPSLREYWDELSERKDYFCTYASPKIASSAFGQANSYYEKYKRFADEKSYLHICWLHYFLKHFRSEKFWASIRPPRHIITGYIRENETAGFLMEECNSFLKDILPSAKEMRARIADSAVSFGFSLIDVVMKGYLHEFF